MARARNIKPGFFTNDLLAEVPALGRLLFAGLWTIADRDGRLEDRPKKIKAQVLPYDDCDVEVLLQALHEYGFILRYVADGGRFIQVVKWKEHQNPHVKESESTIPALDKNSASTVLESIQTETSRADSLNPITDSLNPHPLPKPAAQSEPYTPDFEEAWAAYPERPGASKKDSFKAWLARLKAGVDPADMIAGVRNYAAYVKAKKTEPDFIKQPVTFFGPAEHFKSDWTPTEILPNARGSPTGLNRQEALEQRNRAIAERLAGETR